MYLTDPRLLERLRNLPPITASELNHDELPRVQHPMDDRRDQHYAGLGQVIDQHPIPTAGIRRG